MSVPVRRGLFPELPATFGSYELLELLPGGGMSWVYKARTRIGKTVVIKILKPEESDPETYQRFADEAKTAAVLNHPNVVSVYDFGEIDGNLFMVMEFLEGQDLSKLLAENRIPELRHQLRIASEAASALRHVHQHGIMHRDVKPGNIFVCSNGTVKLIDFGIARSEYNTFKTRAGFAVGTLHYMSPEQVRGEPNPRTDIYAFGLLLYQIVTGKPPLQGDDVNAIFYKILNEPLDMTPLEALQPPRDLADLVRECTQKDPAQRPADFDEVCRRLDAIREKLPPVTGTHETDKAASGMRRFVVPALAVLVPLLAVLAWWMMRPTPVSAPSEEAKAPESAAPALPPVRPDKFGEMVLVASGPFLFGKKNEPLEAPPFYIDKTEVTRGAWNAYCWEHGCSEVAGAAQLPVSGVTFEAARTFCESIGKRLPRAQEWEKAARGAGGALYPWGNMEEPENANVKIGRATGSPQTAGSYPAGASPSGALDLAGNVWEWVDHHRPPSDEELSNFRAMRLLTPPATASEPWALIYGGSWEQPLSHMNDPALVPARFSGETIGFRCAANP